MMEDIPGGYPVELEIKPRLATFLRVYRTRLAGAGVPIAVFAAVGIVRLLRHSEVTAVAVPTLLASLVLVVTLVTLYSIRASITIQGPFVVKAGWLGRSHFRRDAVAEVIPGRLGTGPNVAPPQCRRPVPDGPLRRLLGG